MAVVEVEGVSVEPVRKRSAPERCGKGFLGEVRWREALLVQLENVWERRLN